MMRQPDDSWAANSNQSQNWKSLLSVSLIMWQRVSHRMCVGLSAWCSSVCPVCQFIYVSGLRQEPVCVCVFNMGPDPGRGLKVLRGIHHTQLTPCSKLSLQVAGSGASWSQITPSSAPAHTPLPPHTPPFPHAHTPKCLKWGFWL